jgi:hypothetical protein
LGIGVSFRGHDGQTRKFDLTGVPKVGDEAAAVLGSQQRAVREALSAKLLPDVTIFGGGGGEWGRVRLTNGDNNPGPLCDKMLPNGSVQATESGVSLKGDEKEVFAQDVIYGKIAGEHGYRTLAEYDGSTGESRRIGVAGVGGKDVEKSADSGSSDAVWQTISRLRIETDDLGRKILCQFERDIRKTKFGRIVEVGGERRSEIGFISEEVKLPKEEGNDGDDGDDDSGGSGGDSSVGEGVISLNDAQGVLSIIGGKGVRIVTSGQTIKIVVDEKKDYEDEDPNVEMPDPCAHVGGGDGVDAGGESGGEGAAGGGISDDVGGVKAEDEIAQMGVNDCDK